MGKNDLKRAASKHSQNLADMFKRKKLSTSDIPTTSTTSENLAITNPVTSDVTSSTPAVVSPDLSETENVITPADVSKLPVAESPTLTSSLESGKQSSDDVLPTAIDELFQPRDPTFNFPLRSFCNGRKEKRFNRNWLENKDWKSWLHYNPEKDAAFCATCVNATRMNLISNKNAEKAFISNGFTNWLDAGTKNRGFDKHFKSESHKEAHACLNTIPETCGDIANQISTAINNERSANRQNLLKILSNVRFLARQALPLRGHGSGEDSNFTQLYILREEDNEGLKAWRTEKKINKYVHSTIQNEMMQIMALKILREIADNLRDSDFFTMMCDEATDVKNVSELVVCLRWVDENLIAHDEFIGLKDMPSTDAESIVRELKDVLLRMRLKLERCRGQCYDGCSTMSGAKSGVAVQIKSEENRALYTHCYAHSINLAVGDTMKSCPVLQDTIDNTYELTKLVKKSPKRDSKLRAIQGNTISGDDDEYEEMLRNPTIKLFCHTRWTVRADCLKSIIENFDELQELWDWSLQNCSNSEMKGRIQGIKVHSLKFSYCFGIHLAYMVLAHTDNLNQTLQGTQMTAVDAQVISRACVTTLQSLRSEDEFNLFWAKVNQFVTKHNVEAPCLPRRRNPSIKHMLGKAPGEHPEKVEDDYRRKYYAVLDTVVSCIKERFEQPDYEIYSSLEQLLVKAAMSKSYEEEFVTVTTFYHDDIDGDLLSVQLKTLPAVIGSSDKSINTFYDVRELVKGLKQPLKALISQVVKIIKLIIVMPATNAVSERSFSAMRRLFTYLRTNMGSNRLNNAMVLHVHKERLDKLSLIDVANDFIKGNDHRKTLFGSFDTVDLKRSRVSVKSVGVQVNM